MFDKILKGRGKWLHHRRTPEIRFDESKNEDEDDDNPWKNQPTQSTLCLPIVGKRKEQSSTEGSGILLKKQPTGVITNRRVRTCSYTKTGKDER